MDSFVVSARKYRPQTFDTVVGQSHITTTLKNAIRNGQLAHAFLFCGPRGVGKTTCARILAKTINCENLQPDGEACNVCPSCESFNAGASLNIHELDAASNNSVDDIRTLVEQVRFAPQAGKYKVYIVDEVHMLSTSAFNAFLKTLEEPPPYAIFILATTEKHKILPTILSRCQIFDFRRITTADTVEHLAQISSREGIKAEKAALHLIARKSEGCMRDALSILDKIVSFTDGNVTYANTLEHLNILDDDDYFKLLGYLLEQDLAAAMLLYDEINRKGFEGDLVLNGFAGFLRNLMVCKDARAVALLDVAEGKEAQYQEASVKAGIAWLVSALNVLNEAELSYKMARNRRLHVELCVIRLNFLSQAIELSVDAQQTVVRKRRLDGPVALKSRSIPSLATRPVATVAPVAPPQPAVAKAPVPSSPVADEARLYIEPQKVTEPEKASVARQEKAVEAPQKNGAARKNLLDALRDKYGHEYSIEEVPDALPLALDKLKECWESYISKLAPNKHSTLSVLRTAVLALENETRFSVTVPGEFQRKFIEQERTLLTDCVQQAFRNRGISFSVFVEDHGPGEVQPAHLNSRERFDRLAANYPLVKELKDRLRMDIDI